MTIKGSRLAGRRVLVVEDNFHLAFAMASMLEAQGAGILGPVGTVKDAVALIVAGEHIDGAVLDINLRGEMVYPVADILRTKNVPMVLMTGYEDCAIEPGYAEVPRVQKPVAAEHLIHALFG